MNDLAVRLVLPSLEMQATDLLRTLQRTRDVAVERHLPRYEILLLHQAVDHTRQTVRKIDKLIRRRELAHSA